MEVMNIFPNDVLIKSLMLHTPDKTCLCKPTVEHIPGKILLHHHRFISETIPTNR